MDVCAEEELDVGVIVARLKAGVETGCVTCGEAKFEGVEAWSVANRSGVVLETGRLHPAVSVKMNNNKMSVVLLRFGFNGFKVALLACQNFCAKAPAIGAGYFFIERVIFLEAGHTLHFGEDKTEV